MRLSTDVGKPRLRGLPRFVAAAIALLTMWLVSACGTTHTTNDGAQPTTATTVAPNVTFERADDPIERIASLGGHCFETATDADTARRRAADNVAAENTAQQNRLDQTGALMDAGRPYTVTDIRPSAGGGSCYLVRMHTIQAELNEDLPPSGCCAL